MKLAIACLIPLCLAACAAPPASHSADQGRDWSQVDSNGDHSVSPEELSRWLAKNPGPLAARK